MDPCRCTALQLPNHISHCVCRIQAQQNMDVIAGTANRLGNRTSVADDATNVSMQWFTPWVCDDSPAAFRAKDNMVVNTHMG